MTTDAEFFLCLTHDIDRPHKRLTHTAYYGARERPGYHLATALSERDPYFQFERIMAMEDKLGVRSAFYVLNQPPVYTHKPAEWLRLRNWFEHLGRYDPWSEEVVDALHDLDDGGWEVGLHASLQSFGDRNRLSEEKDALERVLGHTVNGVRQHHLQLEVPDTWRDHAAVGLQYDASLGSATTYGFQNGFDIRRPFGDEFTVFPLTLMDQTLPDPADNFDDAWSVCKELLDEAAANGAVMTILWHLRYFSEDEFPGYRRLYRRLVERAQKLGAWVGTPAAFSDRHALPEAPIVNETQ